MTRSTGKRPPRSDRDEAMRARVQELMAEGKGPSAIGRACGFTHQRALVVMKELGYVPSHMRTGRPRT